jgi:high-affinity Fe2+/Pb2+ permease
MAMFDVEPPADLNEPLELDRDETPAERIDRNFNELLGELRVALPGVQVLFAFLLTVPFAQGFTSLSGFERGLYFAVLLLTAIASAFLIAPTAYHRIQFRRGRKPQILWFANRAALIGLAFLALAMSGAILLITDFLFGAAAAIPVGTAALLVFGTLWYLLPWARMRGLP